jgi:hypothetical protein
MMRYDEIVEQALYSQSKIIFATMKGVTITLDVWRKEVLYYVGEKNIRKWSTSLYLRG